MSCSKIKRNCVPDRGAEGVEREDDALRRHRVRRGEGEREELRPDRRARDRGVGGLGLKGGAESIGFIRSEFRQNSVAVTNLQGSVRILLEFIRNP